VNLASVIEDHPDDSPALVGPGRRLTYGQLRAEVASLRGGLGRAGVQPGDRVGLVLANDWPFVVTYLAVLGVGAVAVPVDPTLPAPALEAELSAVGATAAFVGATAGPHLASPVAGGHLQVVVVAPDFTGEPPAGALAWTDLSSGGSAPVVECQPEEPAVLIFTAGTAGSPKAAVLTHGSLRANLDQVQRHPGRALIPGDISYGVLPLFHVFGLNVVLGLSLLSGASVVLVDRFHAEEALEDVPRHGVTVLAGAPPMFSALAAAVGSERPSPALDSLRLAVSGASALAPEVADRFQAAFGLPLWQGYGLTEASPVVTSSVIGGQAKAGSVGVPLPGVEVRLVDEEGEDALIGDPGELWVRGANVFAGYWEDPQATASVLTPEGWLRTGDVGVADDQGFLYLVDRSKDLIIVSGFNVYPAEVEEVLSHRPEVAEVAVVGAPDSDTGEAVVAHVVPAAGTSPDENELKAYCRGRLARYKCPTRFVFSDALPHGMGGKLLRRALRQQS
jgi:long-chain acyl-CoA synthetase